MVLPPGGSNALLRLLTRGDPAVMRAAFACRLVLACVLLSLSAGLAWAENWPQWRGPNNDGVSNETNLPTKWSGTQNIAWTLPMPGMGGSTPVVWGDRIFLTSEDNGDLLLLCVSTSGKELWKRKLGSAKIRARNDEGNGASSTPSTDGKHVWAFVGSGDLACYDFDGKEVWKLDAQKRYGKFNIQFGMHTTPVLYGDRLYLQLIHSGGAWVIALDKATGETLWKVERKSDGKQECEHSYASPVIWHRGKEAYLVTHGNDYAIAHRLDDGKEIWRVGGLNPKDRYNFTLRFVASPVATPELIVVPSAKNGPVVGVKPDAAGMVLAGSTGEQWRRANNTPDVPSPLVHDGLVYLCRENGVLICMDARTGKQFYEERTHSQRHRASPVYADGKIYLTARDGTVSVVKAGPKFELLATNRLPDQVSASPAISHGRIYLRGFKTLYAIGAETK
jgi:outer membrane protein assembly factor BamB